MKSHSPSVAQNEGIWSLLVGSCICLVQGTVQENYWEGMNWGILQQYGPFSLLWPLGRQKRLYASGTESPAAG